MRRMYRGCAAVTAALGLVVPAAAQATTTSQSFTTPGEHLFVVPPAVTSLNAFLVGGNGGDGAGANGGAGGAGATEMATIAVTPGEKLYLEVGGNGGNGDQTGQDAAGYNGGGPGSEEIILFAGAPSGGGGGGASDIRTVPACPTSTPACSSLAASLASRLVVAGGGGGGGGGVNGFDIASGGPAGNADAAGKNGQNDGQGDIGGAGGGRGKTTGGGAAGLTPLGAGSGVTSGMLGAGGTGGESIGGAGGGGGGGVYGGGGGQGGGGQITGGNTIYGAGGGGGGGGASSLPPGPAGVSNLSLIPTDTGAQPIISLTWTLPPPTALTTPATGVTNSAATLSGTVNPNDTPLTDCHFSISPAPPSGSTISCAQQVGSGGAPVLVTARLLTLKPSTTYTARLVAVDAQGTSTGAPISFTTLPPDPRISKLAVKITRRHGRRAGAVKLTVSQPATLLFGLERKKGKRWVILHRSFAGRARAGTASVGFSVRGLTPGRYRLTALAVNSAGERSAPQRTTFSISR